MKSVKYLVAAVLIIVCIVGLIVAFFLQGVGSVILKIADLVRDFIYPVVDSIKKWVE